MAKLSITIDAGKHDLIDEDLQGVGDFAQALVSIRRTVLRWMIYANRGFALLLQGSEKEAQGDFDQCPKPNNGHRVLFELHLRTIEGRIKERRRQRVERQKSVAENKLVRSYPEPSVS